MMERILLSVLCLSGWNFSSCLLHQYHFVADRMNWTEAQTYCREKYTDLATIENTEEMNQLINTVSSAGHSFAVWIGLYSNIDWRWSDGYTGRGAKYKKWNNYTDNEPDFYSANQFCVSVEDDGGWWDWNCSLKYSSICYNGTQMDPKFVVVSKIKSWSSAQRYCREKYTDLATVTKDAQNQEILKLVPSGDKTWIGLFRDPHIYWSDGSGSSFTYWYEGPKPLGRNRVVCGAAVLKNSGRWTFRSCGTKLSFVCYGVPPTPVKRQVVKVKIRTDSSVDLNDPAVRADILRKYQDSLKEKGVSGVTLKWREQPDGKVFHKEGKRSEKKKRQKTEL